MFGNSSEVSNFNRLNLKLNRFNYNEPSVLIEHWLVVTQNLQSAYIMQILIRRPTHLASADLEPSFVDGVQFTSP